MDDSARLAALDSYQILDTPPEKELNEIAEIASAICDMPISLISLVDEHRQWFKAKEGLKAKQTPRKDSFCQHALQNAEEVLVVDNPRGDERFKDNPLVLGDPYIRFYAGAPLVTPGGHVLGTLCVIDSKQRTITDSQKKALQLLAKKAIDYLETRKVLLDQNREIERSVVKLKKLTDQAPGAIYQFEMKPNGQTSFPFISRGLMDLHPMLDAGELKKGLASAFDYTYPDDLDYIQQSIHESYLHLTEWNVEYRVIAPDNSVRWHWAKAHPEREADGTVVWYGTVQDITERKEYISTLEQMLFDISHVLRRPVATMLGLISVSEDNDMQPQELREHLDLMKGVTEEMDSYLRQLNQTYQERKVNAATPQ